MDVAREFALVVDGWFDGERRHGPATFRIDAGRVADIAFGDHGADLARSGLAVERGSFLIPGLVDAHVHLFLDGAPTDARARAEHMKKSVDELADTARANARQALACGVTLVRDAGDKHGINHRLRAESATAGSGLPRVRSAGSGLKRANRYGAFIADDVFDERSIRDSVTSRARASDEIKLVLTGIIDFDAGAVTDEPQFTLEEAKLVVSVAQACGRKTLAHCSGAKGLAIVARAGVGSIEHGFFMDRETLAIMRDHEVAWTPTFSPVDFQWRHPQAAGWSERTVGNLHRILDRHAEHLRIADEMGVVLLLGTDAGSMGVEHGHAVLDEIDRYLEAGLSLEATLGAATGAARRHFGFAHPLLAKGAPFEAVLLASSPFESIGALRTPLRIWLAPLAEPEAVPA
jgi:imidazolonepropionase-like amidohydrolase